MRISAESEYSCRALLELALNWPGRALIQVSAIAKRQDIPIKYLEQILIQLKSAGLVESVRGKQGGYRLAKAPREISLGEVMRKIKGPLLQLADTATQKKSVFTAIWKEVEGAMVKVLDKVNFEDIANKAKSTEGAMVYQI
ncbi:MAG: Rrf2 family transcriptional regulator [Candidatus Omnitrophica bacterium CG07_land_8_20_14_0_80_42_15]|uniref:Rrf2 family transcriptional regulator n=1 Tax=Candidatus Aquitaenariimonas noxiae TaxID=1974741 RepID=A0A2J0KWI9_9BACT|nr:MAG: Rrf2 family transcriptional regulator [Candidatus Omnitrophica bacterium CG07_land_8_20_14_0_80_42_15]